MRRAFLSLCFCFLVVGASVAQKPVEIHETGKDSFDADFPAAGQLRMHIRSGELKVLGSDENKIRIHYWGKNSVKSNDVKVRLKTVGNSGELYISVGPRNDFEIEIRVPRNTDLYLRMPAGEVDVSDVMGNKDIEVHAGDLTIGVGKPEEYAHVDASVHAGDLDTGPFGVAKDGLFRSFKQEGNGKYRLHAHVGAGDLTFE